MAVVSEAFAVCRSIVDIVFKLQELEEDWFTISDGYRAKVRILSAKLKIVKDHVDDRDLPEAHSIVQILKSAEAKVRKEELKVEKLRGRINNDQCWSWGWWVWARVTAVLFPQKLEQTINEVIEEINTIPGILKMEEEVSSQLFKFDQRQAVRSTIYDNDDLYVPLWRTQSAVFKAIEKGLTVHTEGTKSGVVTPIENGRLVVLLHGRVGTGKTTLARYVCKYYQGNSTLFDYVHWESCGPDLIPDPSTKLYAILSSLSPTMVSDSAHDTQKVSRSGIISKLKNFLKRKRTLIILDHVADEDFLLEMRNVAQGCPHLKYLVTSQIPHLCDNLRHDTEKIAMGDTTKDEAREILSSLVGLEPRVIPRELQDVADKVIAETEGNPLALACWAGNFCSSLNKTDEQTWWDAYGNLRMILNDPEKKLVLGRRQRRSLWEAMELCINSSKIGDVTVMFFFIYACPGSSVPEEVFKNWHECIDTSSTFWKSVLNELSSRGLLERTNTGGGLKSYLEYNGNLHESTGQSTAWSLRPLVKLYMGYLMASTNETMKNEIMLVMDSFLGDKQGSPESSGQPKPAATVNRVAGEKAKVAIALCALYFDPAHADPSVKKFSKSARSASNMADSNNNVIDLRRQAVEPIIWLLGQPKRTGWTEERRSSARKIFLKYVFEDQLHGDGFAGLLTLDAYHPAQVATITALLSIFAVEESMLHVENGQTILHSLLVLLDSKARYSNNFNEAAFKALETVLGSLFKSFSQPDQSGLHLQATLALTIFVFEDSIAKKVVEENKAVADLLESLSEHDQGDLTEQITRALRKITSTSSDSIDQQISNEKGVLAGLVKNLSEQEKPGLQEDTLFTLWQLSSSNSNESTRAALANEPGAALGLVKFLGEGNESRLQLKAATILASVALHKPSIPKFVSQPGALAGLVRLCLSANPSQVEAARALCNLSATRVHATEMEMRNDKSLLTALVKCLDAENKTDLRWHAATGLRNLLYGSTKVYKMAVAKEAGALASMLKPLSERDKPDLQLEAAKALCEIVKSSDDSIKLKIINEDGALAAMVESLSEEDKLELQECVADLLWYLAEIEDSSARLRLRNEKGLLTSLGSLSKQDKPVLKKNAKGALKALG